jgi:uncharacterized membrane protein YbhN (UPF0104 family)
LKKLPVNKYVKFFLKVFLSISLLVVAVAHVGLERVVQSISGISPYYLVPLIILEVLYAILSVINLFVLFRIKCDVPFSRFAKGAFLSILFGSYTPGRIGEFSLVVHMNRHHAIASPSGFLLIMINKITNSLVWFIFFLVALCFSYDRLIDLKIEYSVGMLALIIAASIMIAVILYIFSKKLMHRVLEGVRFFRRNSRALFINTALSVFRSLIWVGFSWLVLFSLGTAAPLHVVLLAVSAVTLASILPLSINGIGIREFVFVAVYPAYSISTATAVSAAMLIPVIALVANLVIIILYLIYEKVRGVWSVKTLPPATGQ